MRSIRTDHDHRPARSRLRVWLRRLGCVILALLVALIIAYPMRFYLQQGAITRLINRDKGVVAQEREDGAMVEFSLVPPAWVAPLKNDMSPVWATVHAAGVNYFTFGAPHTLWRRYSDRTDPASPYYQAWLGAYVVKLEKNAASRDLSAWATTLASLDQQAWLQAMGDPKPLASAGPMTQAGTIEIDGHTVPLWHTLMHSHSDLNAKSGGLVQFVGVPPPSQWKDDVDPFHDVTLDCYAAGWVDATRNVDVIVYAASAAYDTRTHQRHDNAAILKNQLLDMMRGAHEVPVP